MANNSSSSSSLSTEEFSTSSASSSSTAALVKSSSSSSSSEIAATELDFSLYGIKWNRTKIASTEMASINNGDSTSIQCQAFPINTDEYRIDSIALYLSRRYGQIQGVGSSSSTVTSSSSLYDGYDIIVNLYEANEDGTPQTLLDTATISAASVSTSKGGWYNFDFNYPTSGYLPKPTSGKLCITMYQDGGDDHNYVAFAYSPVSATGFVRYLSNDGGSTWAEHVSSATAMRVTNAYDIFTDAMEDSPNHQIETVGGTQASMEVDDFSDGDFVNTSDNGDGIRLEQPPLLASIVVDSSGSSGLNDRDGKRATFTQELISRMQDYPGGTKFDIINFGGVRTTGLSINMPLTPLAIKLSLNSYDFSTMNNDGSAPGIDDPVVACGFYNLETNHTYIVGQITAGTKVVLSNAGFLDPDGTTRTVQNYKSVGTSTYPATFSINNTSGPATTPATEIAVNANGSATTHVRAPLSDALEVYTSGLSADVNFDDTTVTVADASGFSVGGYARLIDSDNMSERLLITAIESNTLTFNTTVGIAFGSASSAYGGFVQNETGITGISLAGETTLSLFLKDVDTTAPVVFYLQSIYGGKMCWDIQPVADWQYAMVYYYGDTADISIEGVDVDNKFLPDGTRVDLYVGGLPQLGEDAKPIEATFLTELEPGDDTIFLSDVSDIKEGDAVVLADDEGNTSSGYYVFSIDTLTKAVVITPVSNAAFSATNAKFYHAISTTTGDEVDATISAVNNTTIDQGTLLPDWLVKPYDPPQIPPGDDIDDYNNDPSVRLDNKFEISTINGWASINVLPITEDVLTTIEEKKARAETLVSPNQLTDQEKAELEALEATYEQLRLERGQQPESSTVASPVNPNTTTPDELVADADYSIESPVFLENGEATSSMSTNASILEDYTVPGFGIHTTSTESYGDSILAKKYTVYPVLTTRSLDGKNISYVGDTFDIYFASPIHIYSNSTTTVSYTCQCDPESDPSEVTVCGGFVGTTDKITINYSVFEKSLLMKSGKMRIRVYDATRTHEDMVSPETVFPDLQDEACASRCDENYEDPNTLVFTKRGNDDGGFLLDTVSGQSGRGEEASYISEYSDGYVLDIVNGSATFEMDVSSNVVASLRVVAEVADEQGRFSVFKTDMVHFANPLEISISVPSTADSGYTVKATPISATVTYMGSPVADNTEVLFTGESHTKHGGNLASDLLGAGNYNAIVSLAGGQTVTSGAWPATSVKPSVAKTISGVASGVTLGPHGPVTMHKESTDLGTAMKGDKETIRAETSYLGFSARAKKIIEWVGETSNTDAFYPARFWKNGEQINSTGEATGWADGWDYYYLVGDIPLGIDEGFSAGTYANILVGANGKKPYSVDFGNGTSAVWTSKKPIEFETGLQLGNNSDDYPGSVGWVYTRIVNAAHIPPREVDEECNDAYAQDCCEPDCVRYSMTTGIIDANNKYRIIRGCAGETDGSCQIPSPDGDFFLTNHPRITWREPLRMEIFTISSEIFRGGEAATDVYADITFSGMPIPQVERIHSLTDENGDLRKAPNVYFNAYYVKETLDVNGNVVKKQKIYDTNLRFEKAFVPANTFITTIEEDHYHTCEVDENGYGTTTAAFDIDGNPFFDDHQHEISSFSISTEPDPSSHTHTLRSVAKNTLLPVPSIPSTIVIECMVSYDASATPVVRTIKKKKEFSYSRNRVKDTARITLYAPAIVFAEPGVDNTISGYKINAKVEILPSDGEQPYPAPDGTRVCFQLTPKISKPASGNDNYAVYFNDVPHPYMDIDVSASIVYNSEKVFDTTKVSVVSSMIWITRVKALTPEITDDETYLDQAIEEFATIGGSPISDALKYAADRLIQYSIDNNLSSAKKAIYLISDGDQNSNLLSYNSALLAINSIAGRCKTPVFVIPTSTTNLSDRAFLSKIKSGTCGYISGSHDDIDKVYNATIRMTGVNNGTFSGEIDFGQKKLLQQMIFNGTFPTDSYATVKISIGDEDGRFGEWSEYQDATGVIDLMDLFEDSTSIARYLKFELKLTGNPSFDSPLITSISYSFIEPKTNYLVFANIDATGVDFISSVSITHLVENDEYSEISYALSQNDNVDTKDFDSFAEIAQPGERKVILSRNNEKLVTTNGRHYRMMHGKWPSWNNLAIYRTDSGQDVLVSEATYTVNPAEGLVVFNQTQPKDARFTATVEFGDRFSVVGKIKNFSEDGATIAHIGLMWSESSRTIDQANGINRKSIDVLLDESSSSSSESTT